MAYNITSMESLTPVTDLSGWLNSSSDNHLEYSHDQSMMSLANPDDSILVIGPPRLADKKSDAEFTIAGFVAGIQYNESSQVQPLKAIGSRRHIFSKTNQPVSGTISRLMLLGVNLIRLLYAQVNADFVQHSANRWASNSGDPNNATWFANLEEDLFRIPFGMGVIYSSPGAKIKNPSGHGNIGAEYIESCVLQSKQSGIQSGQSMVMESVSFMADRILVWQDYSSDMAFDEYNLL